MNLLPIAINFERSHGTSDRHRVNGRRRGGIWLKKSIKKFENTRRPGENGQTRKVAGIKFF